MRERFGAGALLVAFALVWACAAGAEEGEAPSHEFNWIPPSGYVGDWVYLLQGFHSSLDGFGAGAQVSRPLRVPMVSRISDSDVELKVKARVYEGMRGTVRVNADASFGRGRWSVRTHFRHSTRLRRFWGVGPDLPHSDREEFRPREMRAYLELLRNVGSLRFGVRAEYENYQYLWLETDGLLESGAYRGVSSGGTGVDGFGLALDYDDRDSRYDPSRGWRARGDLMLFQYLGNSDHGFTSYYLDLRRYHRVAEPDVLAMQVFLYGVDGNVPVWRYAAIGGREHTRGYSRNRYLDEKLLAVQAEWRRRLTRRWGMQVFAGTALVADRWARLEVRHHHPTVGAGLSVLIPRLSSIAIRGEIATGDESFHGGLEIGFAF